MHMVYQVYRKKREKFFNQKFEERIDNCFQNCERPQATDPRNYTNINKQKTNKDT